MADHPGVDFTDISFLAYPIYVEELGIDIMLNTKAVGIADGEVTVETADGQSTVKADTVVCAVGQKPLAAEADALALCAPEFYAIGDCIRPENILAATKQAYAIARNIGRI